MNCQLCETAAAQVIKLEADRDWNDDECETVTPKPLLICLTCAEQYYDGTEEYPGTHPLPAA